MQAPLKYVISMCLVCQCSHDACYGGNGGHTSGYFVCRRVVGMGMLMVARGMGHTEEVVGVVVVLVVYPRATYAVAPAPIVVMSHAPFPTRNVVPSAYVRRRVAHHPATIGHALRTTVSVAVIVPHAVVAASVVALLHAVAIALVASIAALCVCVNTGHHHRYHQSQAKYRCAFHSGKVV